VQFHFHGFVVSFRAIEFVLKIIDIVIACAKFGFKLMIRRFAACNECAEQEERTEIRITACHYSKLPGAV
jgi:predicted transcriptional regulator